MTSENLSVGGVRFRTRADYEAALRDQKKIDEIRAHVDFNNKKQLEGTTVSKLSSERILTMKFMKRWSR